MQLLQHFKDLTIHPKNAQELKGLILQLAIQGKLTANWRKENPDVEPASKLLKQVILDKEILITQKKIKKDKVLPKLSKEEIPFNIAKTWIWTRLGEIGTTNVGLTYKPAHINDAGVPVLRSSNIQEGELCLKDLVRVNTDYREKDIIEEGDLLICARNGSRRLVGKCTIIGQIDEVMVFGAFMAIFRSNFNPYLQLFIQSPQYRSELDGVETTTINQITQGNLKATTVPLPPLAEQKEIVKVVETLFKEVEQLEQLTVARIALKEDFVASALQQLATQNTKDEWAYLQTHFIPFFTETANIKKLRETILQLAVQGKLTADWRQQRAQSDTQVEDARVLLDRIQKEKAQLVKDKKIKKEKALPKITKEEIPYELPESWVWCRMNELTELITKGSSPKWQGVQYVQEGEGILFVTSENVGNYKLIWKKKKFVESKFNEIEPRSILKRNDLLMNIVGGSIGRTAIYNIDVLANINQAVTIIRLFPKVSYEYFLHFFNSPVCISYMYDKQVDNARPNLSMGNISKFMIPLPPLEEQQAIVEKVNALMALCDGLEQEVQQSQAHSAQLMQSCLREVLEGGNTAVLQ